MTQVLFVDRRDEEENEEQTGKTANRPAKVIRERESIARATIQIEMQDLLSTTTEIFKFVPHSKHRKIECL